MSKFVQHKANNIVHFGTNPTFLFTPEALYKTQCLVEECEKEVGWLGRIIQTGNEYVCDEVYIIRQETSGAATDLTTAGLVELIEEIGLEANETLRLWGHSHPNFSVSPSSEDMKTPEQFRKNGCEYFFRIICNKKGDIGVTFFNWAQNYYIEDMSWGVKTPEVTEDPVRDAIKAEIKVKVREFDYSHKNEHWDYHLGKWVPDEKKEGTPGSTTMTGGSGSTGGADTIDAAEAFAVWSDIPTWLDAILTSNKFNDCLRYINHPIVEDIMEAHNVTMFAIWQIANLYALKQDNVIYLPGKVEGNAGDNAEKALAELDDQTVMDLVMFPIISVKNDKVQAVMKKYNVAYETLCALAYEQGGDVAK